MPHPHQRRQPTATPFRRAALTGAIVLVAAGCSLPSTAIRSGSGGSGAGEDAGTGPAPLAPPEDLQAALDKLVADGVPGVMVRVRRDDRVVTMVSGVGVKAAATAPAPTTTTTTSTSTTTSTTSTTTGAGTGIRAVDEAGPDGADPDGADPDAPTTTTTTGPTTTTRPTTTTGPATTTTVAAGAGADNAPRSDDHFRIGSQTKTFVATVLLQLEAEKKLKLDDRVTTILPGVLGRNERITVRQLLNHTAGIYDYLNDAAEAARAEVDVPALAPYFGKKGDLTHVWTTQQLVDLGTKQPRKFAPGTDFSYSNTNYLIAGMIIDKLTKSTVDAEIKRRIIDPLGLTQTSFPTTDRQLPDPHLHGYLLSMPTGGRWKTGDDFTEISPSLYGAAMGMVSTAADLERFYREVVTGRLLPDAQKKEMQTLVKGTSSGMGLDQEDAACGIAWGHEGSVFGYASWTLVTADGRNQMELVLNGNWRQVDKVVKDMTEAGGIALCGQPAAKLTPPSELTAAQRLFAGTDPQDG